MGAGISCLSQIGDELLAERRQITIGERLEGAVEVLEQTPVLVPGTPDEAV